MYDRKQEAHKTKKTNQSVNDNPIKTKKYMRDGTERKEIDKKRYQEIIRHELNVMTNVRQKTR